jgi:SAM-dependent methyltransferase
MYVNAIAPAGRYFCAVKTTIQTLNLYQMTSTTQIPLNKDVPWFKRWFDTSHYHRLYGNRNEQEAADFINELTGYLQAPKGSNILDVGCGAGRHCKQLASKGFKVTGIDLSSSSIREAKKWESESLHFRRHDMRKPFGRDEFDYVLNFFTSFGYFKTQEENNEVVYNLSQALKNEGVLVLDYMNVHHVEERLVEREEKEIDGINYYISRWMDEKYFYKKIIIDVGPTVQPFETVEQVARFTLEDFNRMFTLNGLRIEEVFGDYQLRSFDAELSPRLIIVAKKI